MRVAMYYRNEDVRLETMPKPEPGPGELLVRVMASGICGSDVLEWYRIKKAPIVLGHEITGIIEKVGEDVSQFKPGDRVFVNHHVPCNTCRYCLSGNHTVCETLHTTRFFPGGFSEYIRVPAINTDRGTFLLPDSVSFEDGSFIEPLGCVLRSHRLAGIKPEHTLLVIGSGISGLLHILAAKAAGVGRIITTDIQDYKLKKAKEFGASAVIKAQEDVPARVREHNDSRLADIVIVCTGAYKAFTQALDSVDRAGTIICFATTSPDVELPIPINRFWRNSISIMSSYANSPYDAQVAIHMLESGIVNVNQLITHRFPLAETGKGFSLMTKSEKSLKIIIEPQN